MKMYKKSTAASSVSPERQIKTVSPNMYTHNDEKRKSLIERVSQNLSRIVLE
jgi:hypothetical protein